MNTLICITLYALLLQPSTIQGKEKVIKKRQIYREQVLPHAGGKIPDTAFQTDRLLLNQLQKEGIAVPDGVVLEQRNPQVHPYFNKASRPVYRVEATRDGRYTPPEGRYFYRIPPGLETTYLYPQIHNTPLRYPPQRPIIPKIRPLIFPNPLATDNLKTLTLANRNSKNTIYLVSLDQKNGFGNSANTYVNFNNNLSPSYLPQDLIAPTIFSQFDNLFGSYSLRVTRSTNGVRSALNSNSMTSPNLNSRSILNSNPNFSSSLSAYQNPSPVPMMPMMKGS